MQLPVITAPNAAYGEQEAVLQRYKGMSDFVIT